MRVEFIDNDPTFCYLHLDSYGQLATMKSEHTSYDARQKRYVTKTVNLYVELNGLRIKIYKGMLFYAMYYFKNEIINLVEARDHLINTLDVPVESFKELRDYQREDLKKLLSIKLGLFQVSTGYGKTEVISRLIKHFVDKGIKILVVTSSNKARNELVLRCKKYQVDIPDYFDKDVCINIINSKGFLNSNISQEQDTIDYLKSVEVCLFDEVEKSLNTSIRDALENILINRKVLYGFSATTNKVNSDRLDPSNECYIHQRNRDLVSYFGVATCYRLPDSKDVIIKKYLFKDKFDFGQDININSQLLVNELYQNDVFVDNLCKVIEDSNKCVYVPINSRISLDHWLPYLRNKYTILYICSSGYLLYTPSDKHEISIPLDKVKTLMSIGLVDIIFSTISGYNSLDLNNIATVLVMMNENSPDNVLQAVGRCRSSTVIISFIMYDHFIPIYTKKRSNQLRHILDHYKNSSTDVKEIRL